MNKNMEREWSRVSKVAAVNNLASVISRVRGKKRGRDWQDCNCHRGNINTDQPLHFANMKTAPGRPGRPPSAAAASPPHPSTDALVLEISLSSGPFI